MLLKKTERKSFTPASLWYYRTLQIIIILLAITYLQTQVDISLTNITVLVSFLVTSYRSHVMHIQPINFEQVPKPFTRETFQYATSVDCNYDHLLWSYFRKKKKGRP